MHRLKGWVDLLRIVAPDIAAYDAVYKPLRMPFEAGVSCVVPLSCRALFY